MNIYYYFYCGTSSRPPSSVKEKEEGGEGEEGEEYAPSLYVSPDEERQRMDSLRLSRMSTTSGGAGGGGGGRGSTPNQHRPRTQIDSVEEVLEMSVPLEGEDEDEDTVRFLYIYRLITRISAGLK